MSKGLSNNELDLQDVEWRAVTEQADQTRMEMFEFALDNNSKRI